MKTIFKLVVILSFIQMYSQDKGTDPYGGQIYSPSLITGNRYLPKEDKFIGSTYLFSDWKNDGTFYINGKYYKTINVNYNVLNDDIETMVGKDSILVYDKYKIDSLEINGRKFKKQNNHSIYEVLFEGNNTVLIKKYKVDIIEGTYNVAQGKYDKTKIKVSDIYYIKNGENITKYNVNKKSILELCKGNEAKIKKYVKENKFSYKKDADIARILLYNSSL